VNKLVKSDGSWGGGSVRPLTASVSPQVFEALATIAGREEVGTMDE
jgi:hypothetical protein